ncbi:NAD(P)-dependent oxidoreductase [Saccharibacillus qingshengii]|uniref:NAD(P)-dependent oxidoreductase n=1 Tax=Saccharibacillus qingshengii TaxID=1763540 RepID=UPI00155810F7|nr:NAD(P)H-binding protein [Saccharibacillus qingshengii]
MKIAVIGATGETGRKVVERLLELNYEVVAVARRPANIPAKQGLRIRQADVYDKASLAEAVAGTDTVISCIGPSGRSAGAGRSKGVLDIMAANFSPGTVMSEGIPNLLEACRLAGVHRLVMQSGIGLSDGKELAALDRCMIGLNRRVFSKAIKDKAAAEYAVQGSGLEWVIVRPAGLSKSPATRDYTAGPLARIAPFRPLSFADCADCLVRAAGSEPTWIGKVVNVGQ